MNYSDNLGELASAMSKAQAKIKQPKKTETADTGKYKYNYASLDECWEACKDALTENGVSVIQEAAGLSVNAQTFWVKVETLLLHDSGQWIRMECTVPCYEPKVQVVGSATTYARRYALMAAVGLAPEDDDGQAAMPKQAYQKPQASTKSSGDAILPPLEYRDAGVLATIQATIESMDLEQIETNGQLIKKLDISEQERAECRALLKERYLALKGDS